MESPRWPVFMLDGADVTVIGDPASVRRALEPFLAEQPVEFYDAAARRVRLVNKGSHVERLEVESEETHDTRLRSAITEYLDATGKVAPTVEDLVGFTTAAAALIR